MTAGPRSDPEPPEPPTAEAPEVPAVAATNESNMLANLPTRGDGNGED